jgi:flagellar hook-basal body complex protein FliE
MKYYSEKLNKIFDSEDECQKQEKAFLDKQKAEEEKQVKLAETRKARAKEVEDAYKKANEAYKEFLELKNKFIKDYRTIHMSFDELSDLVNDPFKFWFIL